MLSKENLLKEVQFKASRSGGSGGQHVNKVSSKVELLWDINGSSLFNDEQKTLIANKLSNRIIRENYLQLFADEDRSQHKNKELAIKRLYSLIKKALIVDKPRKQSKPSKAAVAKRLDSKRLNAIKKELRKNDF